ncbi:MAG: hypothetical protein AAGG72_09175, partial [Pseudomonadota bacterium]
PFRIAVGVSYGEDTDQPAFIDSEMTVGGSGSVVHVPTGLFVTAGGSFRERTFNDALIANTDRDFGLSAVVFRNARFALVTPQFTVSTLSSISLTALKLLFWGLD